MLPQTPWYTPFTQHWPDSCRTDSPKCKYLFKGHAFKIFIAVYCEVNSHRGCSNHAVSQGLWPPDFPRSCQHWRLLPSAPVANVTDEEGRLMTSVVCFSLGACESEQLFLSSAGNLDSFLCELSVSVFGQLFSKVSVSSSIKWGSNSTYQGLLSSRTWGPLRHRKCSSPHWWAPSCGGCFITALSIWRVGPG